jgi:hypothetical protein
MMQTAMFRVKHQNGQVKQGSGMGLARASGGLGRSGACDARASAPLPAALLLGLTIALAGCSAPEDTAPAASASDAATTTAIATTAANPAKPQAVAFEDKQAQGEAVREFAYGWPAQVSAIPELADRFTAERAAALAEQKTEWDEAVIEFAGQDCTACVNRSFEKTWAVVANLPRFLSLSADIYFYTGGAHGNSGHDALVWDREAKAAIDPKALFRSPAALQGALGDAWCKALKTERKKRLGADYSDDGFFPCPPIADLTVLPGSRSKTAFDRIGLLAAPYVAGSYAEGTYEVTLPVTDTVLQAVKPEYRAAFALGK